MHLLNVKNDKGDVLKEHCCVFCYLSLARKILNTKGPCANPNTPLTRRTINSAQGEFSQFRHSIRML